MICGDIEKLEASQKIIDFLSAKNIKYVDIANQPILDIGSIIPLSTI